MSGSGGSNESVADADDARPARAAVAARLGRSAAAAGAASVEGGCELVHPARRSLEPTDRLPRAVLAGRQPALPPSSPAAPGLATEPSVKYGSEVASRATPGEGGDGGTWSGSSGQSFPSGTCLSCGPSGCSSWPCGANAGHRRRWGGRKHSSSTHDARRGPRECEQHATHVPHVMHVTHVTRECEQHAHRRTGRSALAQSFVPIHQVASSTVM